MRPAAAIFFRLVMNIISPFRSPMWVGSVKKLSVLAASDNPPIRLLSRGQRGPPIGGHFGMDILTHRYVARMVQPVPVDLTNTASAVAGVSEPTFLVSHMSSPSVVSVGRHGKSETHGGLSDVRLAMRDVVPTPPSSQVRDPRTLDRRAVSGLH
jgi:hypothetical protein